MAGLSDHDDSTTRPAPLRRGQGHAAWLLLVLIPVASLISFALAERGGASEPATAALLTLLIALVGGGLVLRGLSPALYPHDRLGLCNLITLTRGAGITVLAGLTLAPQALQGPDGLGWALVALAAGILALDLADGWAARRSGLKSDFGARFDVETDVLFAIVLAVLTWQAGKVGIWFLMLGALRPAFLLALAIWPRLRQPLPDAMWRKTVAAVQMTGQVALMAPVLTPPLSNLLGATILAGVALSFAVDLRWLVRQQAGQQA
jgi:phosphatidylglycerophosphate synthase